MTFDVLRPSMSGGINELAAETNAIGCVDCERRRCDTVMVMLGTPDAYRINNAVQILAEARLDTGGYAYYRLDPIPEPAALVALAGAVALLSPRRR
jgi:hypothetical protein